MAQEFNRKALTLVVAQICQTIGWHSINSTPLELLVDLLHRYLFEVGKNAHLYAEQLGHTNPDLDDLGLAFQEMGINVQDLQEYVQYVDSVPFVHHVPKFPIPRESHLNFLKPGSREVVTRPVYVHEYLPPMHPELENEVAEDYPSKNSPLSVDISSPGPSSGPNSASGSLSPQSSPKLNSLNPFKRPGEPISAESPALKRARLIMEEEARPLREISSVMMTTSGYLSPAREGKLPESRTPLQPSDSRSNSPQPISHYPSVPPEVNKPEKKLKKLLPKKSSDTSKKVDKENKKKEGKEVDPLGDVAVDDTNVAKLVSMKETSKLKAFKPGGFKHQSQSAASSSIGAYKIPKVSSNKTSPKRSKLPPVHVPQSPPSPSNSDPDDKISSAPDRQKLSFFKKISKVKEEKLDRNEKTDKLSENPVIKEEPGFCSGGWVINEERARKDAKEARSSQIDSCIESVIQQGIHDSEVTKRDKDKDVSISSDSFVDVGGNNSLLDHSPHDMYPIESDVSPPHTPTAPKTPEIVHTLLAKEESKKKKKDKSKLKNEMKSKSKELSPKKLKMEITDDEISERPKTPKLDVYVHVPPHPGLIPPLLTRKPEDMRPENPALLTDSPPRGSLSPEKPVTPGTGIDGTSPFSLHTPSSILPYFQPSPTSSTSTPTGVPPTPGSNMSSISPFIKKKSPDGQIKSLKKEHDKDKKDKKEKNKIKKKKDKKDKNKDKSLKKKEKVLKKVKDKDLRNTDKVKDKVKEKKKEKKKKDKKKKDESNSQPPTQPQLLVTEEKGVPKLTLRLGSDSPCPPTPDVASAPTAPKLVIKTVKKPVTTEEERMLKAKIQPQPPLFSSCHVIESESYRREKEKEREREQREREREREKEEKEREREQEERRQMEYEAEREKEKERARLAALDQASRLPVSSTKPSKTKSKLKHEAKAAALAFPIPSSEDPQLMVKASKKSKRNQSEPDIVVDAQGNKVWICPSCKGPDDGRPMIGCDDCDAWYHWVCVNITIAPDDHENWYCSFCTMKKSETSEKKKKKKSKKKPKVPV